MVPAAASPRDAEALPVSGCVRVSQIAVPLEPLSRVSSSRGATLGLPRRSPHPDSTTLLMQPRRGRPLQRIQRSGIAQTGILTPRHAFSSSLIFLNRNSCMQS